MHIILPVAGESTRFSGTRPKWLLTQPDGNLMIVSSIIDIGVHIDSINIVYLRKHKEEYDFKKGVLSNFEKYNLHNKVKFIELPKQTKDQVETVVQGLTQFDMKHPFLVKDCDNTFTLNNVGPHTNFVCYCSLEEINNNNPQAKSYIELDKLGFITNIAEKKIISEKFCCGGYYFNSSTEFISYAQFNSPTRYISDVIFNMRLHQFVFRGIKCNKYEDWGTLEQWKEYKNKFSTLFVDLDGVIFKQSSSYLPPYIGTTRPLDKNVSYLKELIDTQKVEIIFTTSRSEQYRKITEKQLNDIGLIYKDLIMGLQHNKRIIINDFSSSNPYPTCSCINVPRNQDSLDQYI